MSILNKLIKHYHENSFLCVCILGRKVVNKVYNIMFLKKYNINADYTSFIYGLNRMQIGSLNIGRYCRIEMITKYKGKNLSPKLVVGERVIINDRVHIGCANYVEIGDDCLFASNIYISDHNHGQYKGDKQSSIYQRVADRCLDDDKLVIIGKNVWLGEGVAVLPGAKIGNNTIVGANSVVIGEISENCIAVGAPAKVIKTLKR